jgi:GNAT superfamily N-acetyltransferase/uncharacterized glyoxalase superfamily protein PhnB
MTTHDRDFPKPSALHVEPVLAVHDVATTISYWQDVLGFPNKWTWGNPPVHGGVSWNGGAFIQFGLNPELADASKGNSVWIRVRELEKLYEIHQKNNAVIVSRLENKPWDFAEYIVKDINGYYVHFSAPSASRNPTAHEMPATIKIIERAPTFVELLNLSASVGWAGSEDNSAMDTQLQSTVFAVVAQNLENNEVVGSAFLLGDNAFYYVKDVIVHPDWQGKGIGTAMMRAITRWAESNAPNNATIALFTGDHLVSFYRQFGFSQACGMYRQIVR